MLLVLKKQSQKSRMFLFSFLMAFLMHGAALALVLACKSEKPVLVTYITASMVMESFKEVNEDVSIKDAENKKKKKPSEISVKKPDKTKPDERLENKAQNVSNEINGSSVNTNAGSSGAQTHADKNLQKYIRRVVGLVNNRKFYPKESQSLREQGLAVVQLVLDKSGKPLGIKLKTSSGFLKLDEASLKAIYSVGVFPSFPNELLQTRLVIEIPLRYKL